MTTPANSPRATWYRAYEYFESLESIKGWEHIAVIRRLVTHIVRSDWADQLYASTSVAGLIISSEAALWKKSRKKLALITVRTHSPTEVTIRTFVPGGSNEVATCLNDMAWSELELRLVNSFRSAVAVISPVH